MNLAAIPIVNRPPNPRPLEILENTPEKHVIPLLLYMETTRPITDVQAIASKPTGEQLVPLLAAEVPDAGGQVRINMAGKLALPLPTRGLNNGVRRRLRNRGDLRLGDVIDGVQIEIIEERPRRGGGWRIGREWEGLGLVTGEKREIGADLELEAEIGVLEEDAGVKEARAADGELVQGCPAAGRVRRRRRERDEVGDDGGDGAKALGAATDVGDEGGEAGGGAGDASPIAWVGFKFGEDLEDEVVGENGESS